MNRNPDEGSQSFDGIRHGAVNKAPVIVPAIFLFLAVFGRWPYGFYTLLRFAVCGCSLYLAAESTNRKKPERAWILVAVAVLFNPLIPVRFSRDTWQTIDWITCAFFVFLLAEQYFYTAVKAVWPKVRRHFVVTLDGIAEAFAVFLVLAGLGALSGGLIEHGTARARDLALGLGALVAVFLIYKKSQSLKGLKRK